MGYTGKTLSVLSDILTLETAEVKHGKGRKAKREVRIVFAQLEGDNRRRLFRAHCPNCRAWYGTSSALRKGTRKHTFACMTCGHEHTAAQVRKGAEVK